MGIVHYFSRAAANSTANNTIAEVIGGKTDAAVAAVTTTKSLMGYIKGILNQGNKIDIAAMGTPIAGSLISRVPRCIEKSGDVLTGTDDLFVVSGGPILAVIVGVVTTIFGGNTNLRLTHVTTAPAATVNLNAGAVACNTQAAGSLFYNVGATSVFTPAAAGTVIMDPVTVRMTEFILTPGTVGCLSSAARTGAIQWCMYFVPLSPNVLVTAAA
jgi:hypothetical protein